MEIFAFTENAVGYEDPRPEPQLRHFDEINLEVPKSAILGVAGVIAASAVVSSPYTAQAVVRQGDVCPEVGDVQSSLNSLGFGAGTVDNIFGSQTTNAVRSFQASRGLAVDGIVGPSTADALGLGDAENPNSPFLIGNSCGGGSSTGGSSSGTVFASALTVRTGPGLGFGSVDTLPNGTAVTYETSSRTGSDGYVWVRLNSGANAGRWIAEDFLSTGGGSGGTGQETSSTVTASSLTVRTGPGLGFGSVGGLGSGTTVFFDPTSRTAASGYTWVEITQGAFAGRWVAENFLGTGGGGGGAGSVGRVSTSSGLGVRVRSGAGTGFGIVGSIGEGAIVNFDATSAVSNNGFTWVRITSGPFAGSFVARDFLR